MSKQKPTLNVDRLNEQVDKSGLSLGQLSEYTGISKSMLSLMTSGKRDNPSAAILAALALQLRCSVEYLMGMTDEPAPSAAQLSGTLAALVEAAKTMTESERQLLMRIASVIPASTRDIFDERSDYLIQMIAALGGEEMRRIALAVRRGDIVDLGFLNNEEIKNSF